MAETSRGVRISIELLILLEKIVTDFKSKYGIEIKFVEASKYLAEKIKSAGGVKV
jgi:hypothetical protein